MLSGGLRYTPAGRLELEPARLGRRRATRAPSTNAPPHRLPSTPDRPAPFTLLSSMCAASPRPRTAAAPPRRAPRSHPSRRAPALTTLPHRPRPPPSPAALFVYSLPPRPALSYVGRGAESEWCTLGAVVLAGPAAIGCCRGGGGRNYTSQQAAGERESAGGTWGQRLASGRVSVGADSRSGSLELGALIFSRLSLV